MNMSLNSKSYNPSFARKRIMIKQTTKHEYIYIYIYNLSSLLSTQQQWFDKNLLPNGMEDNIISNGDPLTHWGRVTHICVGKLIIIGSDNGLSPGRRQAIIRTNAGILLIGRLGTNFNEIWIWIEIFSFKKMHLKMSSGKWRPFCPGLNELKL